MSYTIVEDNDNLVLEVRATITSLSELNAFLEKLAQQRKNFPSDAELALARHKAVPTTGC